MFGLHFLSPWWLLVLAALPLVVWQGRRSQAGLSDFRRWASLLLRCVLVTAAAAALAEAAWRQTSREVTVVYLLDRSASIPDEDRQRALDYVRETYAGRAGDGPRPDDRAGLVAFGDKASVELAPRERFHAPYRLASLVDPGHSDIAEGLRLAAASFPAGARKRIVLISDGTETKGLALEESRRLAEMGVRVECLPVIHEKRPEVMVERLAVRPEVRAGEPVEVRAVLRSMQKASGTVQLVLDGRPEGKPRRFATDRAGKLPPETFEIRLPGPGFYPLEVRVVPDGGSDTVARNNVGHAFTQVRGEARVLIIYSPPDREEDGPPPDPAADVADLAKALMSEKIEVKLAGPGAIPATAAELAGYDCVIIANVPAHVFADRKSMEAMRAAVHEMGVGLIMIGGRYSFGAGGWRDTPVEEALPVSCQVRKRKVMPNGALVLVMHTCEMSDPNYWGRRISQAAVDALTDQDEAGMIVFDWSAGCSWLFKLQTVGPARGKMKQLINGAQPGDMPDFDPSLQMAFKALSATTASKKHCIVISDGDPSFSDVSILKKMSAAGISVSTVAISPHTPGCTGQLQSIAKATGGRFYYPSSPKALPQIFVKEAITVRRSMIFTKPFVPSRDRITDPIKGFAGEELPQLDGYVVTTARPRAEVPLTVATKDGLTDPVLAHWRYGQGKAAAFTSTAASDWASHWISWPRYQQFWSQLVRWTSRASATGDLDVRAEIRGGKGKVIVEAIDEKGRLINGLDLKGHAVDPKHRGLPAFGLVQTAPGRYEGEFQAGPAGAYQVNVVYEDETGTPRHHITGASSAYSPEFARLESDPGLLAEIARSTGGSMLTGDAEKDRAALWARNLPAGYRVHPGWEWLLWIILILFPLDVALRRVMIDWRAAGKALKSFLGLVVPQLRPATAEGPDPTMAALMAEKERIRSESPAPASDDVRSRFIEQLTQARRAAPAEDEDALRQMLKRHKDSAGPAQAAPAAAPGKKKAEPARPKGISGYAGALLDAKKRALEKEKKKDKDKGKQKG